MNAALRRAARSAGPRRAAGRPRPLLHARRALPRVRCACGGRPGGCARRDGVHLTAAGRVAAADARRPDAARRADPGLMPWSSLAPVRVLLPGGAGPVVGADAASARVEAVHPGRELRLLRRREPGYAALLAAVTLANQLGAVLIARAADERARKLVMARDGGCRPAVLGVFKYYGFFADEIGRVARRRSASGCRCRCSTLALPIGPELHHLPGDLLRRRRQARAHRAGLDARLRALPLASSRTWSPARSCARASSSRSSRRRATRATSRWARGVVLIALGLVKKVAIADFLARDGRRHGVRASRRRTPRPTSRWPPTPTPRRSTATSPATRTSRSASPC